MDNPSPLSDVWRRVGAMLLAHREQTLRWNRATAAKQTEVDRGIIVRIERGENMEIASLERYVHRLGFSMDELLSRAICGRTNEEALRGAQSPSSAAGKPFPGKRKKAG